MEVETNLLSNFFQPQSKKKKFVSSINTGKKISRKWSIYGPKTQKSIKEIRFNAKNIQIIKATNNFFHNLILDNSFLSWTYPPFFGEKLELWLILLILFLEKQNIVVKRATMNRKKLIIQEIEIGKVSIKQQNFLLADLIYQFYFQKPLVEKIDDFKYKDLLIKLTDPKQIVDLNISLNGIPIPRIDFGKHMIEKFNHHDSKYMSYLGYHVLNGKLDQGIFHNYIMACHYMSQLESNQDQLQIICCWIISLSVNSPEKINSLIEKFKAYYPKVQDNSVYLNKIIEISRKISLNCINVNSLIHNDIMSRHILFILILNNKIHNAVILAKLTNVMSQLLVNNYKDKTYYDLDIDNYRLVTQTINKIKLNDYAIAAMDQKILGIIVNFYRIKL